MLRLAGGYRRPPRQIEFTPLARALKRFSDDAKAESEGGAAAREIPPSNAAAVPPWVPDRR